MTMITIYPEGPVNFGFGVDDDGAEFVQIELTDGAGVQDIRLDFAFAAFVSFADHMRMVADELIARRAASTDEA